MKELYKIAAKAATEVYSDHMSFGSTGIKVSFGFYKEQYIQVIAFAGTDEVLDWFDNLNLTSKKGIKKGAYQAAAKAESLLMKRTGTQMRPYMPTLVTGHSLGGAAAIAYAKLFGAEWCVAFCPARCLRYWTDRKMPNTTIFIDPDDPVPMLGRISFGHPVCPIVHMPEDTFGLNVGDHYMGHVNDFIRGLP